MSDLPIKATLKAGNGYDAPWLTVDAATPEDLEFKLQALANGSALAAVVEAANTLKAANNAAPLLQSGAEAQAPAAPAAPAQPQGWGATPPQQQAAPTGKVNGAPHPEGKTCPACGAGVVFKRTNPRKTDGKTFEFWTCPNQSAKGDGHFSAFAD